MSVARIASINLECPDPLVLAGFWAALLGARVTVETPDFCVVETDSIHLGTVRVRHYRPPTWPSAERSQQLHLDLRVENRDEAEEQALRLGATKETHQPDPGRARVLRDPAGHPFCIRK